MPAGSYVEVRGSGYTVSGTFAITMNGTAQSPVFIRGVGNPEFTGTESFIYLRGRYFIVEGLKIVNTRVQFGANESGGSGGQEVEYAALRRTEITGWTGGSGSIVSFATSQATCPSSGACGSSNVVLYNNWVHHNGDTGAGEEVDTHGFHVSTRSHSHHIWYVDNHISHNSGDSIQVGTATPNDDDWAHHIYIGRNVMHDDRENAVDIKASRDVIVSQNTMHSYAGTSSSSGEACATHDDPDRVWILYNTVYNANRGITSTGANGFYVIGNLLYGIRESGFSETSNSQGHAIMVRATSDVVVANNTADNIDHGIGLDGSDNFQVVNNIVANVSSSGHHVGWSNSTGFGASTLRNNLFEGPLDVDVGGSEYNTLASVQNGGTRSGNLAGDPAFNAPPHDYSLLTSSSGLNAGMAAGTAPHEVYSLFNGTYAPEGLGYGSIAADIDGNPRPVIGTQWDLGAFEIVGPRPAAPQNLVVQ